MNALNEAVVSQLHAAFKTAAADDAVRGIVIAGSGKAFIAGADIRFFVKNIEKDDIPAIQTFFPVSGSAAGGTQVTVTGSDFATGLLFAIFLARFVAHFLVTGSGCGRLLRFGVAQRRIGERADRHEA